MRTNKFDNALRRIVAMAFSVGIATTLVPLPGQVAMADPIDTLVTSYQPVITETIDANGFKHPGVGLTKEMLENARTQILAKKEPWYTHFNMMLGSASASRTPRIRNMNGNDPTKPAFYGLTSQGLEGNFIADAGTVYTQAVLYLVTGDDTYRSNAMHIIRLYSQMDPAQYAYYTDSHIHTGIPLQRMTTAAEILRATSTQTPALAWTDDDTVNFSRNLVTPVIQTFDNCNCRFMNQHLYTTIAKMSGSIFMGDRDGYNQAVEWFMVNKDAPDPAWTGSIKQLFRTVTKNDATGEEIPPQIQHVEMGRDQAHGAGDLTNSEIL
ncbi:alginate lyase family protein, partial [Massilia sp. Root133]